MDLILEMLLDPFEEGLDLPAVFVDLTDSKGILKLSNNFKSFNSEMAANYLFTMISKKSSVAQRNASDLKFQI